MDEAALRQLMHAIAAGELHPDDAVRRLRRLPFADLGFARVDHHRRLRQGLAEAVYGPGKSPGHCAAIVQELLRHGDGPVVLTRADDAQIAACDAVAPGAARHGRTLVWRRDAVPDDAPAVALLTAGTADAAVADECAAVLDANGVPVRRLDDVGVAGLHRLLAHLDVLEGVTAVVVVAGMEGALASVVGGLVAVPVVAVPTSVGYGAALEGVTALLGMLASCASGLTVVGIDNGFGAAMAVLRLRQVPAAGDAGAARRPPGEPADRRP